MKRVMLGMAMACALAGAGSLRAQQPDEREAVKAAVLDYVEAIYQAQPDRIQRSVHPDLAKRGYFRKSGEQTFTSEPMTSCS